jgi:hypothetical protein
MRSLQVLLERALAVRDGVRIHAPTIKRIEPIEHLAAMEHIQLAGGPGDTATHEPPRPKDLAENPEPVSRSVTQGWKPVAATEKTAVAAAVVVVVVVVVGGPS